MQIPNSRDHITCTKKTNRYNLHLFRYKRKVPDFLVIKHITLRSERVSLYFPPRKSELGQLKANISLETRQKFLADADTYV